MASAGVCLSEHLSIKAQEGWRLSVTCSFICCLPSASFMHFHLGGKEEARITFCFHDALCPLDFSLVCSQMLC